MSRVICNIPHASILVPEWAKSDIRIEQKRIRRLGRVYDGYKGRRALGLCSERE